MKRASEFGIRLSSPPVYDWLELRKRKDKIVSFHVGGVGQLFKSHGVTHLQGWGRVTAPGKVTVSADNGQETTVSCDNVIIATGSRAISIPAFPVDGSRVLTSDHLLELEHLPKSMLIVGGGVIGCEWASMLALLEVKVTVVELMQQLLPLEDATVAQTLEREFRKHKVDIFTQTKVESIKPGPQGISAKLSNGQTIEANQVLASVGRAFNSEDLGLEELGVEKNKNGSIKTGPDMRTNIKGVYAIGDVRGEILLAYTANHDGAVAVDNCLGGKRKVNYAGYPSVIFTHPEIGSVGLTEAKAAEKHDIAVGRYPFRALAKANAENETAGEVKIIGDKKTDRLLGVHIIGIHAPDVIHVAAAAVRNNFTVEQLGDIIFGHPVISEAVMEAAHDLHGMCVHLGKKKK